MPFVLRFDDFTEIQERSKREKQLKENHSKLQQTIKDLSSSVRSQRTSLAKLLTLLQLPVEPQTVEDEDAFVNTNFDAIEARVKELLASAESKVVGYRCLHCVAYAAGPFIDSRVLVLLL